MSRPRASARATGARSRAGRRPRRRRARAAAVHHGHAPRAGRPAIVSRRSRMHRPARVLPSLGCRSLFSMPLGLGGWVCAATRRRKQVDVAPGGQRNARARIARRSSRSPLSVAAAIVWLVADGGRLLASRTSSARSSRSSTCGSVRARRPTLNGVTPNPFVKQYLMTAGPTPVPPAVSQAMAAPMLYHRAPAFVELYERVLAQAAQGLPDRERRARRSPPAAPARMESAVANLVRPGTPVLVGRRRQVRRALDRARRGLRRRHRPLRAGLGRAPRPRRDRPPAGRERRHRGRLRHAERDLDRRRPRRPGDRRGRARATTRSSPSTPSPASAPPSCARTSGASTWSSPARRRR